MVGFGFRDGMENFRFFDLINPAKMAEFWMASLAMKIFTGIFALLLFGFTSLIGLIAQIYPKALQYTTLSTVAIVGMWFIFFYSNYVQALIVGIREYRFWKFLGLIVAVQIALFFIPHYTWFAETLVRLLGFGLGIMILYPNRATLKDIVFGYLSLTGMLWLLKLILELLLIGAAAQIESVMKFVRVA